MRLADDTLWLSPTDLSGHLDCRHLTSLARAYALGDGPGPHTGGEYQTLIQQKGDEHERRYLKRLEEAGRRITEIPLIDGDFHLAQRATLAAMAAGDEVIYQATFAADGWRGRADFLERVPLQTSLGDWGYEAVDTKLARGDAHPHHVLQLGVYSRWIAEAQGVTPRHMHLELGSGRRVTIAVADVAAYVRRAQTRLRDAVDHPPATTPVPCAHCAICGYRSACNAWWTSVDDLSLVAGLTTGQAVTLRDAAITTLTQLAGTDPATPVPEMAPDTLAGMQWQARLQLKARRTGTLPYDRRPRAEHRGFARLPRPDAGDIFLDLEGDPFWDPAHELWFLFGLVLMEDGKWRYRAIWAHDPAQEARAFEELIDLITARHAAHPGMHVYHYSPAEPSALRRLAAQPSSREAEVDDLLRGEVFVDLYAVIRQGLVIGAASYGLKTTEKLAGFTRTADATGGADAVVAYERWRGSAAQALLDDIARYNEEDCIATLELRDWLVDQRPPGTEWWDHPELTAPTEEVTAERAARLALRAHLVDGAPRTRVRRLAGELLEYHRREQRPAWWQWFARRDMSVEELLSDSEAISGLERTGRPPTAHARSLDYELAFPAQNHKIGPGGGDDHTTGKGVNVVAVDDAAGTLIVRRGADRDGEPLPVAIVPSRPIGMRAQQQALMRLGESVRDATGRYRAVEDLLAGAPPRFASPRDAIIQTLDPDAQIALARDLDHSTLLVQGPPGTGKTWIGGRMIAALIGAGARVGVSAVSHKAINNLLAEVEAAAREQGLTYRGVRKTGEGPDSTFEGSGNIENTGSNEACEAGGWDLVAGTAWLFAREGMDQALDYLVIDEAGQMSLADAAAVGTAARNLILLGDPLQLPHVSQAVHVEGLDASVLGHLLGDHATVPPERGLFLALTRRMHPDVCGFISREIYEGRLESHAGCARQGTAVGTGIRHLAVAHTGRTSSSREEAEAIRDQIARLVGQEWTDAAGTVRPIARADLMVVAPYNAQVRMLRSVLGPDVRVGTVDKFQGQEAPIVFFSMATSSGEDLPRDVGFLFSRNRLNVAISRARCLAYVVCNPALLDARPRTVEDMRLISTLCALVEEAERQAP